MRIAITGASGNVGTSVLEALSERDDVERVVAIARRLPPGGRGGGVEWRSLDIARDRLDAELAGVDVVVHLAWLIQPSRDEDELRRVNVEGSRAVFEAAARAGVGAVVYASSVGAYSPGPKNGRVDENWPTGGVRTSFYSRHKSEVERILDRFEDSHPEIRVVRLRPGLIFKDEAASEIRRLFIGPLTPTSLFRRRLIPIIPALSGLRFQAVHSHDVGRAYALAATDPSARGAFNIAAEPVLDPSRLADLLGARAVAVPAGLVRAVAAASWRLRLQPTPPGWLDMALQVPLMSTDRAREMLGWRPERDAGETLLELLEGIRSGSGASTPPLAPGGAGRLRSDELTSGVGRRNP